jgi:hypothetical protein
VFTAMLYISISVAQFSSARVNSHCAPWRQSRRCPVATALGQELMVVRGQRQLQRAVLDRRQLQKPMLCRRQLQKAVLGRRQLQRVRLDRRQLQTLRPRPRLHLRNGHPPRAVVVGRPRRGRRDCSKTHSGNGVCGSATRHHSTSSTSGSSTPRGGQCP